MYRAPTRTGAEGGACLRRDLSRRGGVRRVRLASGGPGGWLTDESVDRFRVPHPFTVFKECEFCRLTLLIYPIGGTLA
jgi:hypothetical protein